MNNTNPMLNLIIAIAYTSNNIVITEITKYGSPSNVSLFKQMADDLKRNNSTTARVDIQVLRGTRFEKVKSISYSNLKD